MKKASVLSKAVLDFDHDAEVTRIAAWLAETAAKVMHKRGLVIAISGGIDSSVCAALAVRALGPKKVFGLMLPEKDSSSTSLVRGKQLAEQLGIPHAVENIGTTLEAIGCYRWRDEAIRAVFPAYGEGWKNKIAIAGGIQGRFNYFNLLVQSPEGEISEKRLPVKEYLQIVAATNYKQRIRKTIEYFHADRLHYAVIGTQNRLEYDQGFFVKNGDGSADIKPIVHLYKTQVYALAKHLRLPKSICTAMPTTDTYSMQQGQDEFYFALPYDKMDIALWAHNHAVPAGELATFLGISNSLADNVYKDIESKRQTTRYLHAKPYLVEPVKEIA